jgi:colanic acid biosynthesis glycosyl transferase WcaI
VAQHLTDFAVELAPRGHQVRVIASRRAYDDPTVGFPARENHRGVEVIRVPCAGFGNRAKWRRALDFISFISCFCPANRLLLTT